MPNPFSINIVTSAGANLIAQATSTNQIVIVDALSGTQAALDASDLASKTTAFYDGISGTIQASSATDNTAKVIARFGNAGAQSQIVRSVCIRGKLANQADSAAVIMAAMSDPTSEIYFPSNASPTQIIRFPFLFAINADDEVETVYADGATMADLERFVSMYKAGDPTQGDAQSILGVKTFTNGFICSAYASFLADVLFSADIQADNVVCDALQLEYSGDTNTLKIENGQFVIDSGIYPNTADTYNCGASDKRWENVYCRVVNGDGFQFANTNVQISEDDGAVILVNCSGLYIGTSQSGYGDLFCDDINGDLHGSVVDAPSVSIKGVGNGVTLSNFGDALVLSGSIVPTTTAAVDLGSSSLKWGSVYANNINGLLVNLYDSSYGVGSLAEVLLINQTDSNTVVVNRGTIITGSDTFDGKSVLETIDGGALPGKWAILNKVAFDDSGSKVMAVRVE